MKRLEMGKTLSLEGKGKGYSNYLQAIYREARV